MIRMNQIPPTRASLIVRLPDASDAPAWREFTEIYEPFVYQYARRRGLQDSDARELVQEVFLGVAKAVKRFKPDPDKAKFRTWLFRIARNQLATLARKRRGEKQVDTGAWQTLEAAAGASKVAADAEFDKTYRSEVFMWASQRVKKKVQSQTWDAFWQTCVEGQEISTVAENLGIPRGAVYVARSRVIRRLRKEVSRFEDENQ